MQDSIHKVPEGIYNNCSFSILCPLPLCMSVVCKEPQVQSHSGLGTTFKHDLSSQVLKQINSGQASACSITFQGASITDHKQVPTANYGCDRSSHIWKLVPGGVYSCIERHILSSNNLTLLRRFLCCLTQVRQPSNEPSDLLCAHTVVDSCWP